MLTRDPRPARRCASTWTRVRNAPVLTTRRSARSPSWRRDEAHYGVPQDAEWAIEDGRMYLVQTRPVTTFTEKAGPYQRGERVLLHGLGASPGTRRARARARLARRGEVEAGEVW